MPADVRQSRGKSCCQLAASWAAAGDWGVTCNPNQTPSGPVQHVAGDSITQIIKRTGLKDYFNTQFSPAAGWAAYPLGVSGNDVEDLAWRLFSGSERPARAPKAVALLIGVNNLQARALVGGVLGAADGGGQWLTSLQKRHGGWLMYAGHGWCIWQAFVLLTCQHSSPLFASAGQAEDDHAGQPAGVHHPVPAVHLAQH